MSLIESPPVQEREVVSALPIEEDIGHPPIFIGPGAVSLVWFAAMAFILAINPGSAEPIQPTLVLTVIGNVAAIGFYATLGLGALRRPRAAALGLATGSFMLAGHFLCGFEGHLPMTGAIWPAQLMAIAGATVVSGLALATRR